MRRNALAGVALLLIAILLAGCAYTGQAPTPPGLPAQDEDTGSYSFVFIADAQADPEVGDYSAFANLARVAAAIGPVDQLIIGGDSVNDEWNEKENALFSEALSPLISDIGYAIMAPGNHDRGMYQNIISSNPAGLFFAVFDSNEMGAASAQTVKWVYKQLEETVSLSSWRIVVMHHPMWTVADIPKDEQRAVTMREYFLPLLEEAEVDLILCGHQHLYARTLPMRGEGAASDGTGIVQVMVSSGAKQAYHAGKRDYISVTEPIQSFLYVTATKARLTVTAYNADGEVFDSFSIAKEGSGD